MTHEWKKTGSSRHSTILSGTNCDREAWVNDDGIHYQHDDGAIWVRDIDDEIMWLESLRDAIKNIDRL